MLEQVRPAGPPSSASPVEDFFSGSSSRLPPGMRMRSNLQDIANQEVLQPRHHQPQVEELSANRNPASATIAELTRNCCDTQALSTLALCCADAAKSIVKSSYISEYRPDALSHIKTISLLALTSCAVMVSVIWLREVLVPLLLAIFFTLQLEPVLFFLVNPAMLCAPCSQRAADHAAAVELERVRFFGSQVTETSSDTAQLGATPAQRMAKRCRDAHWRCKALTAVLACISTVVLLIGTCVYLILKSVTDFSWRKYVDSPKTREILTHMKKLGANPQDLEEVTEEVDSAAIMAWLMDGPLMRVFSYTMSFAGTLFLMCLFLAFLLLNDLGIDSQSLEVVGIQRKARLTVRRYMRIKTQVSIAVALLIWGIYEMLQVDLAFLFSFCAFLLNYIPHIGYTISALLPLPLVFLDPEKTWGDFVACIIWPMLVHQVFSNFLEPRLLAKSLDLHPIVVLVALGFWTVCWGAVGAILSTPMTSVLRLVLLEFEHPYAIVMVGLLEGQWGPSSRRKEALGPNRPHKAECSDRRSLTTMSKAWQVKNIMAERLPKHVQHSLGNAAKQGTMGD